MENSSESNETVFTDSRKTPYSIFARIHQLRARQGSLLMLLCEKTVGIDELYVDLSYQELAEMLGVSRETIARTAKVLIKAGDVEVEKLISGVYRWYVPLEPGDFEDPDDVNNPDIKEFYRVREPRLTADGQSLLERHLARSRNLGGESHH